MTVEASPLRELPQKGIGIILRSTQFVYSQQWLNRGYLLGFSLFRSGRWGNEAIRDVISSMNLIPLPCPV